METLNLLFFAFTLVGPIVMGAYMALFSRHFTLVSLRLRKAVLKIGFNELDIRIGQAFAVLIGIGLAVIGLIRTFQFVTGA